MPVSVSVIVIDVRAASSAGASEDQRRLPTPTLLVKLTVTLARLTGALSCFAFIQWSFEERVTSRSLGRRRDEIHVQYTSIDSSRLRALTTRLSRSLVGSGSGRGVQCLPEVNLMDGEVQNVDDSLRLDRIVTIRSNGVSTRLNERRLEVTRHT